MLRRLRSVAIARSGTTPAPWMPAMIGARSAARSAAILVRAALNRSCQNGNRLDRTEEGNCTCRCNHRVGDQVDVAGGGHGGVSGSMETV